MKLYIELYFSSSGAKPMTVIERLKDLGFEPVFGKYDFVMEYDDPSEYGDILDDLFKALQGTRARYRVVSRKV